MGHVKTLQLESELAQEQEQLDASQKIARILDQRSVDRSIMRVFEENRYKTKARKRAKGAEERAKL